MFFSLRLFLTKTKWVLPDWTLLCNVMTYLIVYQNLYICQCKERVWCSFAQAVCLYSVPRQAGFLPWLLSQDHVLGISSTGHHLGNFISVRFYGISIGPKELILPFFLCENALWSYHFISYTVIHSNSLILLPYNCDYTVSICSVAISKWFPDWIGILASWIYWSICRADRHVRSIY